MGTCVLDATLETRGPTLRLPIKAFRGGRSNRCILTVQRLCRNAPAICGPLLLYLKDKHFRVRRPEREAGHCACAYDSTGAAGRGCRGRASSVARAAAGTQWKPKASEGGTQEA